jgi:5-methylcytosine-specific restriction protein A
MLRKFVLDPDPIFKACGERLSSQVDHILPMSEGGTEYNPAGLQGICTPCHQAESAREAAQRARD